MLLLYLLHVCVFWRGEAKQLEFKLKPKFFRTPPPERLVGGFFVYGPK